MLFLKNQIFSKKSALRVKKRHYGGYSRVWGPQKSGLRPREGPNTTPEKVPGSKKMAIFGGQNLTFWGDVCIPQYRPTSWDAQLFANMGARRAPGAQGAQNIVLQMPGEHVSIFWIHFSIGSFSKALILGVLSEVPIPMVILYISFHSDVKKRCRNGFRGPK